MKKYKKVYVPATTREVEISHTCDICEEKIELDNYEVSDVEISCKVGSSYPEGGFGDLKEFDICADCFNNKLIPFMNSLGAKADINEWDW